MFKPHPSALAVLTSPLNYVSHQTLKPLLKAAAHRVRLPWLQAEAQHDNRRNCSGIAVLHMNGAAPMLFLMPPSEVPRPLVLNVSA